MKEGIFGFSRKEVLWFTAFFLFSIFLMTFCVARLIGKYYSHSNRSYSEIKKYSHDLWSLQDITLCAVNVQRGSLNLIIYSNNIEEAQSTKANIKKNRDSLSAKLLELGRQGQFDKSLRSQILKAGYDYLDLNSAFIMMISDTVKSETAVAYNVNTMRPALRRFTDLTRGTGKVISTEIQRTTESGLNIFYQFEFWLLAIALLPYFYFLFRFLHLVVKMILWDSSS